MTLINKRNCKIILSINFLCLFFFSSFVSGQTKDSVKTYKLREISIEADKELKAKIVIDIDAKELEDSDALNLSDVGRLIPSVKVQTNSRGETLYYIRGGGERQITLLFDGVPLNTPWDNRIDLSLIPTDVIESINITKGIPSTTYGANAISGVVEINSLSINDKTPVKKLSFKVGENNSQSYSGLISGNLKTISFLAAAQYSQRDGFSLPSSYKSTSNVRTNSFNKSINFFGKIGYYKNPKLKLNLTFAYNDAEKGVPPEENVIKPRYWQYPLWKRFVVNLSGELYPVKENTSKIVFSFSGTSLKSQINQFKDISYSSIDDIEKGKDVTFNGRIVYSSLINENALLKLSLIGYTTTHTENILSQNYKENIYRQNVLSSNGELEYFLDKTTLVLGLAYDISSTPRTGDKPAKDDITDYGINFGLVHSFNDLQSFHFSIGRKVRFPTLRETFSGALGRFIPNPSLRAETAVTIEGGFRSLFVGGDFDVSLFYTSLTDGIVRTTLPGRQFKRINKDQIRTYGIETVTRYKFSQKFRSSLKFTLLNSKAKNTAGEFADTLEYKPRVISSLDISYFPIEQFQTNLEFIYSGIQFGLKEGSLFFQRLPDYLTMNIRAAYNFKIDNNYKVEIYSRVNNLFDKLYFSQWGLPESGLEIWGGIKMKF
ncbi:MAG: TonB-dependent receptor [Bacteroidetes bacterium]|nr:TonB-dependent receptor [Bacteroidota bacterium]